MARHLKVHRTMVDAVWRGAKAIPDDWCPLVEGITTAGISADQLRPDLAWVRVEMPGWPHPAGKPLLDLAPGGVIRG